MPLPADQVQQDVGDNAHGDTLGDAVEQRHGDDGEIRRNRLGQVVQIEVDLGDSA
ncbi:MAG: hypothetical protein ACLUSL_02230 [Ruminococcus sp.]